jgi:hypothetical protein
MNRLSALLALTVLGVSVMACGSGSASPTATPTAPEATLARPTVVPTAAPSPTPELVRQDIRATHLTIPSLGIDTDVQLSQTIPYVYSPPPGCPGKTEDTDTLTTPNQGIATPEEDIDGLENKAWIFGHSRWQGTPGVFSSLEDLNPGDEVFVDGVDRATGENLLHQRFVVNGLYLADTDSGGDFLTATSPEDIPPKPEVVLQTSVREDGAGKQWILNQQTLLPKATNLVDGDLGDPCKYLLLFVTAQLAP